MEKRIRINFLGFKIVFKNPFAIQNNKIFLIKNGKAKRLFFVRGLKVNYYGANNRIEFYDKVPKMQNVRICFGENCRVKIRDSKYVIKNLDINARSENVSINIGKDFSIESGEFDFHGEPNLNINIGNDCQFGCNIRLDTADGHTIYNNVNKVILNRPKDINIGDHISPGFGSIRNPQFGTIIIIGGRLKYHFVVESRQIKDIGTGRTGIYILYHHRALFGSITHPQLLAMLGILCRKIGFIPLF